MVLFSFCITWSSCFCQLCCVHFIFSFDFPVSLCTFLCLSRSLFHVCVCSRRMPAVRFFLFSYSQRNSVAGRESRKEDVRCSLIAHAISSVWFLTFSHFPMIFLYLPNRHRNSISARLAAPHLLPSIGQRVFPNLDFDQFSSFLYP